MDLITGLLKSQGHNSILTIVDHGCSHTTVFLPYQKSITGLQIAQLYYKHLYPWFGLPKRLISNRDPHFTSHFGQALAKELGITWNLSIAYHPQTNRLTEQKNQWVEQFLHLITTNQDNWSTMLPLTTLVHNNTQNVTTNLIPNQLLNSLEPTITPNQSAGTNNPTAELWVNQLRQQRVQATKALNTAANGKSPLMNMFKHRQKVWLKAKNLALPYGSVKLAPRHHSPFPIAQVMSPVMYKLMLPHQWTIHPVFHMSLLTPYSKTIEHGENYLQPPPDLVGNIEQYKVKTICSHQHHGKKRQLQYLVKWQGYPKSDNIWEPAGHLQTLLLLKEYHHRHPLSSIKRMSMQQKPHLPSWLPHLTVPTVTTTSTVQPSIGTYLHLHGT